VTGQILSFFFFLSLRSDRLSKRPGRKLRFGRRHPRARQEWGFFFLFFLPARPFFGADRLVLEVHPSVPFPAPRTRVVDPKAIGVALLNKTSLEWVHSSSTADLNPFSPDQTTDVRLSRASAIFVAGGSFAIVPVLATPLFPDYSACGVRGFSPLFPQ